MIKKKKPMEKTDGKVTLTLEQYEIIGNRAYLLDRISGYFYTAAILDILTLGLYLFIFLITGNQNSPENAEFYKNVIPILAQILAYSLTVLLLVSLIFQWSGLGYKKLKKYNKNDIIKKYLIELSTNPENIRKSEIIKHLIFNLIRLRETEGKKDLILLHHYHWRPYHKIGHKSLKFEVKIINKIISFLEDAVIFLDLDDYKLILTEIAQLIEKNDYRGIAHLFIKNEDLFNKIEVVKSETKMNSIQGNLKKIKNFFEWTSIHGRNWIAIIILITLIILYICGKIQNLPIP